MFLAGNDQELQLLRSQLEHAILVGRDFSGAGFFTRFSVDRSIPSIAGEPTFHWGDVRGTASKVNLGFFLLVEEGRLNMLEGYSEDGIWPAALNDLKLFYMKSIPSRSGKGYRLEPSESRDMERVRTAILRGW